MRNISGYLLLILLCVIGITTVNDNNLGISSLWDFIFIVFYGVSLSTFTLTKYILLCIMFLGFVYLYQISLNLLLNGQFYYVLIRYKSYGNWFYKHLFFITIYIFVYLVILFIITFLIGYSKGYTFQVDFSLENNISSIQILYHFFVNGYLQLLTYMLIVLIFNLLNNKGTVNLLILGGLLIIGLPVVNNSFLPSALNSMAVLTSSNIFEITIKLSIYLFILLIGIIYIFKKKHIYY